MPPSGGVLLDIEPCPRKRRQAFRYQPFRELRAR